MKENKSKTCCFTGHRRLPAEKMKQILINLDTEVDNLIRAGVTNFISGGALGFDQVAASLIVAKKEMMKNGVLSKKSYIIVCLQKQMELFTCRKNIMTVA